jgi:DNA-binding PadR family transcriptional regulator
LKQRSGGVFDLPEGTVYPALHRLEAEGLLSSGWVDAGRGRGAPRVPRRGRAALVERRAEWERFSRAVDGVLA